MRVASVYAFSDSPETAAWDKLVAWINKRDLVGAQLLCHLNGVVVMITDDKMFFKPRDFVQHTALLQCIYKMAAIDLGDHNTYCHRKDGKPHDDKRDRKDPPRIRDRCDLAKSYGCKRHSGLIDRVHKREIINNDIAHSSNQHGYNSEDYR